MSPCAAIRWEEHLWLQPYLVGMHVSLCVGQHSYVYFWRVRPAMKFGDASTKSGYENWAGKERVSNIVKTTQLVHRAGRIFSNAKGAYVDIDVHNGE